MDKIKKGIPLNVKLRTYKPHIIIGLIMLILYFILSLFIFENTIISFTEVKRANSAKTEEIIFSNEKNEGEYFYYLKNYYLKSSKNVSISADILMIDEFDNYGNNDIFFEGKLDKNSCAISNNIAKKYNIKIGNEITFIGKDKKLKVARIINPQTGIDKEYKREGIIILGYDNELLDKQYQYVTFNSDLEFYYSLINLYRISDWKKDNKKIISRNIFIFLLASLISISLCEIFLFKNRQKDYLLYLYLGKKKIRLFLNILFENIIKYVVPLLLVFIFNIYLTMYGIEYLKLFLMFISIIIIVILGYTLSIDRRVARCQN